MQIVSLVYKPTGVFLELEESLNFEKEVWIFLHCVFDAKSAFFELFVIFACHPS
jgi:hypothetical protein